MNQHMYRFIHILWKTVTVKGIVHLGRITSVENHTHLSLQGIIRLIEKSVLHPLVSENIEEFELTKLLMA